jgi:hypothetical protein
MNIRRGNKKKLEEMETRGKAKRKSLQEINKEIILIAM